MPNLPDNLNTRVAMLTPTGRGAVATIAVLGPDAAAIVAACFQPANRKSLAERSLGEICYGRWLDTVTGEEVVVARRDETSVEIHCHGGEAAPTKILADLEDRGCESVSWHVWAHGQTADRLASEALAALAEARSERTASILLDQHNGALSRQVDHCCNLIKNGKMDEASLAIDELMDRGGLGLHLTEPWRVVIAGAPNVGKSSLLNALVGYDRSIVVDLPGTTRDVVASATVIDGWPVLLADTAGLRISHDEIEAAGVALAEQQATQADLLLLLFDASQTWSEQDAALAVRWPGALMVHNKADLPQKEQADRLPGLAMSATTGAGIDQLLDRISRELVPNIPPPGAAVPFMHSQIESLQQAKIALDVADTTRAVSSLLEVI